MRILFVGMANSVHLGRWISQLYDTDIDIGLFPVATVARHPLVRRVRYFGVRGNVYGAVARKTLDYVASRGATGFNLAADNPYTPRRLAATIERFKPDLVHSLEFQHASYLAMGAKRILGSRFPPWMVSNWGSDIYLFS